MADRLKGAGAHTPTLRVAVTERFSCSTASGNREIYPREATKPGSPCARGTKVEEVPSGHEFFVENNKGKIQGRAAKMGQK